MAASSSSPSSSSQRCLLLALLLSSCSVEARPHRPRQQDNKQVSHFLFGAHLSSLILAPPSSSDIMEGSAQGPAPPSPATGLAVRPEGGRGSAGRQEAVPRFFLDFLRRHRKLRGRSRKSMSGGRGCFGMKMDRIGSLSGLGC